MSAVELYTFLTSFIASPNTVIAASLRTTVPRIGKPFTYSKIIIVAHSLGAVVSRLALLEAHKNAAPWAGMVELVLFAPAHSGADIVRLAGMALTGLPVAMPAVQLVLVSLQDLEPKSTTLVDLASDVTAALGKAPYLRAKTVILAKRDGIVSPKTFGSDPTPIVIPGVGHMSVCKPQPPFLAPLDAVTALL